MSRVRLNLAALLLVCGHVTWGQGSQRARRAHAHQGQHLCGTELTEMLVWICGDAGVHGKRSGSGDEVVFAAAAFIAEVDFLALFHEDDLI